MKGLAERESIIVRGLKRLNARLLGWVLDRHWTGALDQGARIYERAAFDAGFLVIAACLAASVVLALLTRETYCQPYGHHRRGHVRGAPSALR